MRFIVNKAIDEAVADSLAVVVTMPILNILSIQLLINLNQLVLNVRAEGWNGTGVVLGQI